MRRERIAKHACSPFISRKEHRRGMYSLVIEDVVVLKSPKNVRELHCIGICFENENGKVTPSRIGSSVDNYCSGKAEEAERLRSSLFASCWHNMKI